MNCVLSILMSVLSRRTSAESLELILECLHLLTGTSTTSAMILDSIFCVVEMVEVGEAFSDYDYHTYKIFLQPLLFSPLENFLLRDGDSREKPLQLGF